MKTTEQIIKSNVFIAFDDTQQGNINMNIKNPDEQWISLKDLKEFIKRLKDFSKIKEPTKDEPFTIMEIPLALLDKLVGEDLK